MAVYVDDMRAPVWRMKLCHMIADTDAELHAMAQRIGVARRWFQGDHYDVCLSKRGRAIDLGARPVTMYQAAAMRANKRATGSLGDPATAIQVFRARRRAKCGGEHVQLA